MSLLFRCLAASIVLSLLTGCATRVNLRSWQQRVEEYVEKEGNGDPAVLRDVTLAGGRPGFGMIGGAAPQGSDDANGLFLGQRVVENRPVLFYLVAILKNQKLSDLRLTALTYDASGRARWRVGDEDDQALRAYRDHKLSFWKTRFPGKDEPPAAYLTFPGPEDQFELDLTGEQATALHIGSGSRWRLELGAR